MLETPDPTSPATSRLSADGAWWWNGSGWVPAGSEDGLWTWDGEAWRLAPGLTPEEPQMLAGQLDALAQSRFAEAGRLLVERRAEWTPTDPELTADVDRAAALLARLNATGAGRPAVDLNGLFRRAEPRDDRAALEGELWPLSVLIGRRAPRPSLKEADELLGPAHRLGERAAAVSSAAVILAAAEEQHRTGVDEARSRVAEAVRARDAAVADLERVVRERELEEQQAREELTLALRSVRMPGPGVLTSRYDAVALFENRLETPDLRAPVAGASATIGTAPEVWAARRTVVGELLILDTVHAADFHADLVAGAPRSWLLVMTGRGASLLPCPEGRVDEAERFIAELTAAAREAEATATTREAEVRAAESALEAARGDGGAVLAARAALAAALDDPALRTPVEAAERALAAAERPGPDVKRARRGVEEAVAAALVPPVPLRMLSGSEPG